MQIGILQTGQSPDILRGEMGDYPGMFARLLADRGLDFRSYLIEEMEFPDSVRDCDGWLITGSRHGTYEDHPFIKPLEEFIRTAHAANVPMVGICFGHQIIAQALGGTGREVRRTVGPWAARTYDFGLALLSLSTSGIRIRLRARPEGADSYRNQRLLPKMRRTRHRRPHILTDAGRTPSFAARMTEIDGLKRTRAPGVVPDEVMIRGRHRGSDGQTPQTTRYSPDQIADFFKQTRN